MKGGGDASGDESPVPLTLQDGCRIRFRMETQYRGVVWQGSRRFSKSARKNLRGRHEAATGDYVATIKNPQGKIELVGNFDEEMIAAMAVDQKAVEYYGDDSLLNFDRDVVSHDDSDCVSPVGAKNSSVLAVRDKRPYDHDKDGFSDTADQLPFDSSEHVDSNGDAVVNAIGNNEDPDDDDGNPDRISDRTQQYDDGDSTIPGAGAGYFLQER